MLAVRDDADAPRTRDGNGSATAAASIDVGLARLADAAAAHPEHTPGSLGTLLDVMLEDERRDDVRTGHPRAAGSLRGWARPGPDVAVVTSARPERPVRGHASGRPRRRRALTPPGGAGAPPGETSA
ncbi:hypothetical protein SALBM217S_02616 [Streptomyces griseoloalbus]